MPLPDPERATPRRAGFADTLLGALGAAVIRVVLALARFRARLTRSSWHG